MSAISAVHTTWREIVETKGAVFMASFRSWLAAKGDKRSIGCPTCLATGKVEVFCPDCLGCRDMPRNRDVSEFEEE